MNNALTQRQTVLIVEDDASMLALLDHVLSEAGFETTTADHGQDAVAALKERSFDVLITDVGLPDINGIRIGDLARELYQNQIVIIGISGDLVRSRTLASLQLHADDFLGKPFDTEELVARIKSKLRRRDAEAE